MVGVDVVINGGRVTQRAVEGLTCTVGRAGARSQGEPSYCAATLAVTPGSLIAVPFDTLTVETDGMLRFTGHIAETTLTHDEAGRAFQRINAVGALAQWGSANVGEPPWPAESVAARATRIAAVLGEPVIVEGGATQTVTGLDVDRQRGSQLLQELAATTGGWVYDHRGQVHLQALDARKVTVTRETWDLEPIGSPWTDLDPALTWLADNSPAYLPITLRPEWVRASPTWVSTHEIANRVTVTYGDPEATVTVDDEDSQALYGVSAIDIRTSLAEPGDALELAGLALSRNRRPLPQLSTITLDRDQTPPDVWLALMDALPGTRVTVEGLWQPAPASAFLGCLEGWTETFTADGNYSISLFLSDVRMSLAVPTWDELAPGWLWTDEPAEQSWESELT